MISYQKFLAINQAVIHRIQYCEDPGFIPVQGIWCFDRYGGAKTHLSTCIFLYPLSIAVPIVHHVHIISSTAGRM